MQDEDILYTGGLSRTQLVVKALLWKKQLFGGMSRTNMVDNLGLKKCHDLRERAQIRLGTLARRAQHKPLARQMSHLKSFATFSQRNPLTTLDSVMTIIIVFNAISIGISCDTSSWSGWLVIDASFVSLFIIEQLTKMWLLGTRDYCVGEDCLWHWFELILVALSLLELAAYSSDVFLGESSLFRVFRILRLAKMMRVCRLHVFKDLVMMFNGTLGGLRTLFWSVFLISVPLYVVALVLRESLGQETPKETSLTGGSAIEHFSSLGKSFFTVFRCILANDCADDSGRPIFVIVSRNYGWIYPVIYCATFIFMTLGLCNVIVAIYVENTVAAAKWNDLKKKEERLRNSELLREKGLELALLAYCLKMDFDPEEIMLGSVDLEGVYKMEITQDEFVRICEHPGFCEILRDLDIAREDHPVLFDTLDTDRGGSLDINELVGGIFKLRGDIRKSDLVGITLAVRHVSRLLRSFRNEMASILKRHDDALVLLTQEKRKAAINRARRAPVSPSFEAHKKHSVIESKVTRFQMTQSVP
jgi:hypothetical protein